MIFSMSSNISHRLNDWKINTNDNIQALAFVKKLTLLYILSHLIFVKVGRAHGAL